MHQYIFENELSHLERVIAFAQANYFPPTYWCNRLERLKNYPQASIYRHRIARLSCLVAELTG